MATDRTVEEMIDSREQSSTRIVLKLCLKITGDASDTEMEDDEKALADFEHYVDGICDTDADGHRYFRGLRQQDYTIQYEGGGVWKAEYEFGLIDQETFQFDTTGGQQHITQALAHVADYGTSPTNHGGAIGVTPTGVEGVDITVPVFRFSKTISNPMADITPGYVQVLYTATGCVNSAPWSISVSGQILSFAAGEVLFLGCSASQRTEEVAVFTFNFAASPNLTGLRVGDITGIAKKGWEYMWVEYEDEVDNNRLIKKVRAVHIEQVYRTYNFYALGNL